MNSGLNQKYPSLYDTNGVQIKVGMTVESKQVSGGFLPPSKPSVGIVEKCVDAFGNDGFMIKCHEGMYEKKILINHTINTVIL